MNKTLIATGELEEVRGTPFDCTRSGKGIMNRKKQHRLPWIILHQGARCTRGNGEIERLILLRFNEEQ